MSDSYILIKSNTIDDRLTIMLGKDDTLFVELFQSTIDDKDSG